MDAPMIGVIIFFTVFVDIVCESAREDVLCELLYANDIVIMSEIIEGIKSKLKKWK